MRRRLGFSSFCFFSSGQRRSGEHPRFLPLPASRCRTSASILCSLSSSWAESSRYAFAVPPRMGRAEAEWGALPNDAPLTSTTSTEGVEGGELPESMLASQRPVLLKRRGQESDDAGSHGTRTVATGSPPALSTSLITPAPPPAVPPTEPVAPVSTPRGNVGVLLAQRRWTCSRGGCGPRGEFTICRRPK